MIVWGRRSARPSPDGGTHRGRERRAAAQVKTSTLDVAKLLLRLGPKQINDEIGLALAQMKAKGVAAGVAAALMVIGLVFVAFLVVALIVAAIAGLSLIFQMWAAALIVGGAFLLIALIFVLVGLAKLKAAMPLKPEDAIRGFRLDLGWRVRAPASTRRAWTVRMSRSARPRLRRSARPLSSGRLPAPVSPRSRTTRSCCVAPPCVVTTSPGCRISSWPVCPRASRLTTSLPRAPWSPTLARSPLGAIRSGPRICGRSVEAALRGRGATAAGAVFLRELVKR
ncbi:phage holin family protein [Nesterenkonia pannonica]|uniref:phage holin family protein n=1 Tax=Nesterenkonia pannonica TaxID=1548602 RepID=UPI0021643780|nr:phage holin family protein [Nesterenkonia pannonica]